MLSLRIGNRKLIANAIIDCLICEHNTVFLHSFASDTIRGFSKIEFFRFRRTNSIFDSVKSKAI